MKINSEKIGKLFEKASKAILEELFQFWGYEIKESILQKSGTQFGFDIFYKITKDTKELNIFIECKASKEDNKIRCDELIAKSEMLEWSGFEKKDIHIYFSPTRQLDYSNFETGFEDKMNNYPFAIINWMAKKDNNLIKYLFLTYKGNSPDIIAYHDFIIKQPKIETDLNCNIEFKDIVSELLEDFNISIDKYIQQNKTFGYEIINNIYWQDLIQLGKSEEELTYNFYVKIDSTINTVKEVVAKRIYIQNKKQTGNFELILKKAILHRFSLIKILSGGGTGKTTFLFHLAKKLRKYNVVFIKDEIDSNKTEEIFKKLILVKNSQPIIFILDNANDYNNLRQLADNLGTLADKFSNIILLLAERRFRYNYIDNINEFENCFDEIFELKYYFNEKLKQVKILPKFLEQINKSSKLSSEQIFGIKDIFINTESISESILKSLDFLNIRIKTKTYTHDWDDWYRFSDTSNNGLRNLYLLIATFFQFGYRLPISFCAKMIGKDEIDIRQAVNSEKNLPISEYYDSLSLKHETIASWFFQVDAKNKRSGIYYFNKFISNISSEYEIQLFIRIINNRDYKYSFLKDILPENKEIELLEQLSLTGDNINILTQLGRIYRRNNNEKAEKYLLQAFQLNEDNYYLNFELGKLFQKDNMGKAVDYLNNALLLSKNRYQTSYVNVEIGKCMFDLEKFEESIKYFQEAVKQHSGNVFANIFLAKAKWKTGDKNKAKDLLRKIIKGNKEKENAYKELSKMLYKDGQHKKNKEVLSKLLEIENYEDNNTINNYVHSCFKQGDSDSVISFLDKIFKLNPDAEKNYKLLNYYASSCKRTNKISKAILYFEKSLSLNTKQPKTQYYLELLKLDCFVKENKIHEALICCNNVLNIDVNDYLLNIKGNLLKEVGDYEASEKIYLKALRLTDQPKSKAQYLNNIALLILESRQINRRDEAIKLCEDAIDICSHFKWSKETLEKLYLLDLQTNKKSLKHNNK